MAGVPWDSWPGIQKTPAWSSRGGRSPASGSLPFLRTLLWRVCRPEPLPIPHRVLDCEKPRIPAERSRGNAGNYSIVDRRDVIQSLLLARPIHPGEKTRAARRHPCAAPSGGTLKPEVPVPSPRTYNFALGRFRSGSHSSNKKAPSPWTQAHLRLSSPSRSFWP